jgi:two-component system C4-dicarboxylate transport response regulator DctD
MSNEPLAHLLIVDDEETQMKEICDVLEAEGYATTGFVSARRALSHLRDQKFDVLLTDLQMPEIDGITFLREARQLDSTLAAIVMTVRGAIDSAVEAMNGAPVDYILKPFHLNTALPVIARNLELRRLREHNEELRRSVEQRSRGLVRANKIH